MDRPRYTYDPHQVYQWANVEGDEARSREDGLLGPLGTTPTRRDPPAQSSQFGQLVISTSHQFPGQSLHSPDNLGVYQTQQRNFTNSTNLNVNDDYGYSRLGASTCSPSCAIAHEPPATDSDMQEPFSPHPQVSPNGDEHEGFASHHPGDYTQYRQYLTPSRSTAQQQNAGPSGSGSGPMRRIAWRVRAKPYEEKAEATELLRLHSPLRLSLEDRKHALRQQFNKVQSNTNSPISPPSSSSASYPPISSAPYLSEPRHQPLADQSSRSTHLVTDPNNLTSANDSVAYHTSSAPGTFDESAYARQGLVAQGGWREQLHAHAQPSTATHSDDSSSSSEQLASSQVSHPVHVPLVPPAQPPPPSNPVGTVFIHSNLTNPTPNVTTAVDDSPENLHFFPLNTEAHRQLRVAMHDVLTSEWKMRNELEPTSQDILQFSTRMPSGGGPADGEYRCLLYHNGAMCTRSWARAERMLAHLRGAIDLRPFACEGDGDVCNCGMRFFAEDTLQQHKKNTKAVGCEYCGAAVTPRNIKRHRRNNCPRAPERPHD